MDRTDYPISSPPIRSFQIEPGEKVLDEIQNLLVSSISDPVFKTQLPRSGMPPKAFVDLFVVPVTKTVVVNENVLFVLLVCIREPELANEHKTTISQ
jgi:hypothetical protein